MNALRFAPLPVVPVVFALFALLVAGCPAPNPGGSDSNDVTVDPNSGDDLNPGGSDSNDVTPDPNSGDASDPNDSTADGLTAAQKLRADRLISVFENDTIELQYAYIENIDDGRGYTAGRAGFTTATADLLVVVERYALAVPGNELAAYLPRLRELAADNSSATDGLDGMPEAWARAAADPQFRAVQDEVVDEEYYQPAVEHWRALGLKTPLALVELYDANIQHGPGDDPDGLPAMIDRTVAQVGGSPATGVDETEWVYAFLDVRRATLENASDPATREAWAQSVYRVEIVVEIADTGNFAFSGPIVIDTPDHQATLP
jgi:chitosanase